MPVRIREYYRPPDLKGVLKLLVRTEVLTAPLLIAPKPVALADQQFEAVVDLSRLGLDYITEAEDGAAIHLGALVPLQTLADSPLLRSQANGVLSAAAQMAAGGGLRRLATLAGAIQSTAGPQEVPLALLTLDATVFIQGEFLREMPLHDFLAAEDGPLSGEFLREVSFPRPHECLVHGALERIARTPRDEAIVAAAALLEKGDGAIRRARLAVAGATRRPRRIRPVEQLLEGRALDPDLLQQAAEITRASVDPAGDFRGSAEYRREMAGVLMRRALEKAWRSPGD